MKIEEFEDQWERYFQNLEVGQTFEVPELVVSCHSRQSQSSPVVDIVLEDLPTLREVEIEFHATAAYRSTGYDPLPAGLFHVCPSGMAKAYYDIILKQFLWQSRTYTKQRRTADRDPKAPQRHCGQPVSRYHAPSYRR